MRRLSFLLLLPILCAWPSVNLGGGTSAAGGGGSGTWSSAGSLGTTSEATPSDTGISLTTSQDLNAGNVAVCVVTTEEASTSTSNGDLNQVNSITNSGTALTWTRLIEICNAETLAASDGICQTAFYAVATTALSSGGSITADLDAVEDKVIECWEFESSATGNPTITVTDGTNSGALDFSEIPAGTVDTNDASDNHLFIRAFACRSGYGGGTLDADYDDWTNTAVVGNASPRVEHRIATEEVSATHDPETYPGQATCVNLMFALDTSG